MEMTFDDLLVDDKAPVVVGLPVDAETLVVVGGLFVVRLGESLVDLLVDAETPDVVGLLVDAETLVVVVGGLFVVRLADGLDDSIMDDGKSVNQVI